VDRKIQNDSELTRESLYKLYIEQQLTQGDISKIFNCSGMTIGNRLKEFNITKKEQKDYFQNNIILSEIQKDLLIGSRLGDGSFNDIKKNGKITFAIFHAADQKEYCFEKFKIVKDFCKYDEIKFYDCGKTSSKKIENAQNQYYFATRGLRILEGYKNMSFNKLMDNLNSNSLCIWYLDDGHTHINKDGCYLHSTIGRTKSTLEELHYGLQILKERFGLSAKINWHDREKTDHRGIRFTKEEGIKLIKIILNSEFGDMAVRTLPKKVKIKIKGID
jgi:hypothetical protein